MEVRVWLTPLPRVTSPASERTQRALQAAALRTSGRALAAARRDVTVLRQAAVLQARLGMATLLPPTTGWAPVRSAAAPSRHGPMRPPPPQTPTAVRPPRS